MKKYCVLVVVFLLSACGGGMDDDGTRSFNPAPTLVSFDIVDSYGVDTGYSQKALAISPYKDGGVFDIFWRVNSLEDYQVHVYLNDTASVNKGILFHSEVCGFGHRCDQGGNVICEYTSDFYLSCDNTRQAADVSILFHQVPESLYMVMEICDLYSANCSYRYYPVLME